MIESLGSDSNGVTLAQLLKRPEIQIEHLAPLLAKLMPAFFERVESSVSRPVTSNRVTNARTIHYPLSTIH